MPELLVDIDTIGANTEAVARLLRDQDMDLVAVTKGCQGEPRVAAAMLTAGAAALADSRDGNLRRLRAALPQAELHRTSLPPSTGGFHLADVNYISSWQNAQAIASCDDGRVAAGAPRKVMLMVETGDEREGVPEERLLDLAERVMEEPRLDMAGVATNYGCLKGTPEGMGASMQAVSRAAQDLRAAGIEVTHVSGGNSSALWLVARQEGMHSGSTELRCGEALLLGHDALHHEPLPGCRRDGCKVRAEVVEEYTRRVVGGSACRMVVAAGHQDIGTGAVRFVEPGLEEIGRSADSLVVEASGASERMPVGTKLELIPGYEALTTAWMSPHVDVKLAWS